MRRLPPLHALRAFEAAARHGHFAKAAQELALTPTAISHQVRLLEDLLGCSLFRRFPRPLRLTHQGEALFPVLRDGLDRFAQAIDGIKVPSQHLTVSSNHSFAMRWLMPRLSRLRDGTGIDLEIDADDRMVDLHAGTVDFAIRYVAAPPSAFTAHALFRDTFAPFCAPSLLATHGAPQRPGAIFRLPLVSWRWKTKRSDAPSWERWLGHAAASDQAYAGQALPRPALRLSEEAHAIEAAISGLGVALVSEFELSLDIAAGRLVRLSPIGLPDLTFFAVHVKSSRRAAEVSRFAEWVRAEILGRHATAA